MPYAFVDDSFSEEPSSNEGFLAGLGRQTTRQASNLLTRGVGLPGDVFSAINEYVANPIVKKFGGTEVPYEETGLGKILPTTEAHRKGFKKAFGEYIEPQNEVEKFTDNLIEDTALLLFPAGKGAKAIRALPKSFVTSLGANIAGEAAEEISGKKEVGNYTKAGSLFFISMINPKLASSKLGDLYNKAEAAIPDGATTSAKHLSSSLDSLKNQVLKNRPQSNLAPTEKFVIDEIEKIESLIKDGKIDVASAIAQKRSLNENLMKHVYETGVKSHQVRAKNLAKPLNGFLNDTIKGYGKKNPEFYVPYKSAEEGFATLSNSHFLTNAIDKNLKYSPATAALLHLFGSKIGTSFATAVFPYQAIKLGYRIANSPTLRNIYSDAVSSAVKQDFVAFNKYLQKLDEEIQFEENNDRFEFID